MIPATKNCKLLLLSSVCLAVAAAPAAVGAAALAIANPGFEADAAPVVGATGWTITSGGDDWFTTTAGQPDSAVDPDAAYAGDNWLSGNRLATGAGSSSDPQIISQLIDLSADASLIDSGGAMLSLGFAFADNDGNDDGSVNAYFYSDLGGSAEIVGSSLTTGVLDPTGPGDNSAAPWELRSLGGPIPTGARSLLVELVNARTGGGSAGNVHFDDFSGAVVPEPGALGLLVLGAAPMIRRRRKS